MDANACRFQTTAHAWMLAAGCGLWAALGAAGALDGATVSISNNRLQIDFELATVDGLSHVVMAAMTDRTTGFTIDTSRSPLCQVTLHTLGDQGAGAGALTIPEEDELIRAPAEQWTLRRVSDRAVLIAARGIPVGDSGQVIDWRLEVAVRGRDGPAVWTADADLSPGKWSIAGLRLPCLVLPRLGTDGDDDAVLFPLTGGLVLTDPIARGASLSARESSNFFNYPGYVESQFMAYYDDDRTRDAAYGGVYVASEDMLGHVKKLYFKPRAARDALHLYVEHFNFARDPAASDVDPRESLRHLSLAEKHGYATVVDLFQGDWVDAAERYRAWISSARPPFVSRGLLADRGDMSARSKETSLGIAFVVGGKTEPLSHDDAQTRALRGAVEFFYDRPSDAGGATVMFVGDTHADARMPSIGNDMGVFPMREGLADFLWGIRDAAWSSSVTSLALNRDIGNWISSVAQNREAVLGNGLVTSPDGAVLEVEPSGRAVRGVTCGACQLMQRLRIDQFERSWGRLMRDGKCAIDNSAFSGKGSESWLCYRPLFARDALADHHHPIGGGHYCADAYRELVLELRRRFADAGMEIVPGGERAHEQLIDTSNLGGRARAAPWDLSFHGPTQWIEGGQPLPLRSFLYHEWAHMTARMPRQSNVQMIYERAYREAGRAIEQGALCNDPAYLTLQRQRMAQWTCEGQCLGVYIQGPDTPLDAYRRLDALDDVHPGLRRNHEFLRELVRLRERGREYLVYGRMLRAPACEADTSRVTLEVAERSGLRKVDAPAVCATAWQSIDGNVCLVVVNYTFEPARARLVFDAPVGNVRASDQIELVDLDRASERLNVGRVADGRAATDVFTIGTDRPARLYILRSKP